MKALGVAVLLVALAGGLAACGDDGSGDGSPGTARRPSVPSPSATDPGSGSGEAVDLASTQVCDLVRQGIDAFNLGDLDETIARFEDAVPPAEDLADQEPSDQTETLLDAVRYYAELPAEDYVEASQSSPEFLRFKEFTLTECAYVGPPAEATDPAIPA